MKKYLLAGTSAFALALTAGAANAQSAPGKFDIKISGDAFFEGGYAANSTLKNDANGNRMSNGDFANRFRLSINPEATADNGLKYGATVRIRANAATGLVDGDRAYIYTSGAFGTVQGGVVAAPSDLTYVGAAADTQLIGIYDEWRAYSGHASTYAWGAWQSGGSATQGVQLLDSHLVDTKIVYYTPRFLGQSSTAGLQGALSYAPEVGGPTAAGAAAAGGANANVNTGVNRCNVYSTSCAGSFLNVVELTANYNETFGAIGVKGSAGYEFGSAPKADVAGKTYEDLKSAQAGLQVSYMGFAVGGGYVWGGKSGYSNAALINGGTAYSSKDQQAYNVGVQYTTGPLVGSFRFAEETGSNALGTAGGFHVVNVADTQTLDTYTTGVMYTVAPGLRTGLEYTYFKNTDTDTTHNDKGSVVLARGIVTF